MGFFSIHEDDQRRNAVVPAERKASRQDAQVERVIAILSSIDQHRAALRREAQSLERTLDQSPSLRRVYDSFLGLGGSSADEFRRFLDGKFRYRPVRHQRKHLRLIRDAGRRLCATQ